MPDVYKRQELWEQKPHKFSPAHKNADFAELVCSNSPKADRLDSASGLLKMCIRDRPREAKRQSFASLAKALAGNRALTAVIGELCIRDRCMRALLR